MRAAAASGHSADLGRRPRDRLDADRPCRRPARADARPGLPKWRCRSRPISRRIVGLSPSARRDEPPDGYPPSDTRSLVRALPSLDQLLALPRRRFDEAAAGLGRGLEINTLNKRAAFERAAPVAPGHAGGETGGPTQKLADSTMRSDRVLERMFDRFRGRVDGAETVFSDLPARLGARPHGRRTGSETSKGRMRRSLPMSASRKALTAQDRILQSLSYKNVLSRGYAVIRDSDDAPVSHAHDLASKQPVVIEFADGRVNAVTLDNGRTPTMKRSPKAAGKLDQGSLF